MSKRTSLETWMERLLVAITLTIAIYLSSELMGKPFAEDVHELRQLTRTMTIYNAGY